MKKLLCQGWLLLVFTLGMLSCSGGKTGVQIDRYSLVHRHNPELDRADPLSPFTVGNGEFAFTVDVTGLQSFSGLYESGIPLATLSQWGWHTIPDSIGFRPDQTMENYDTYGRMVPYASVMDSEASGYFRSNPHRLNLGRIAFVAIGDTLAELTPSDLTETDQLMDLWEGIVKSSFHWRGHPFRVETTVHPELDQIAVRLGSPELEGSGLGIAFEFPYGSAQWGKSASDWDHPDRHSSEVLSQSDHSVTLKRELDSTTYYVHIEWEGKGKFSAVEPHRFLMEFEGGESFEFTCSFSLVPDPSPPSVKETFASSMRHWEDFWQSGGAVDLSGSTHPFAMELERRIVLSQYLMAIQCSGSLPPQETGLTINSWFGKFHLEMHWWHAVHFALWGRPELLEKSLGWYVSILPAARAKAVLQGYEGVRWPKMTSPDGTDSPSNVGVFLIWQQLHPIYFAELIYRSRPGPETLEKYKEVVFETAQFMASYAHWDPDGERYVLGPPLIPAQEIYRAAETMNPAFELSYWAYGLKTAQLWCERLGLARDEKWDHVIEHLASLPVSNGFYQNTETTTQTFDDPWHRRDHPTLLGAFGMLPNEEVDMEMMARTLDKVMKSWNWEQTWGWDYPMVAMTATRVGRPELAIEALMMEVEKNRYLNNGHNHQSERLPLYLPGNGGLLTAIAMMCAGWEGAPELHAPGFPRDGQWEVKYEGLAPLP